MTHAQIHYTTKEFSEYLIYTEKSNKQGWGWILRVPDNNKSQIKLNHATFMDMDSLSRDPAFNVPAQGVRNSCHSLVGWLPETWAKMWPTVNKLEMPKQSSFNIEEGIQSLKETGMLGWIFHLKPTHPH